MSASIDLSEFRKGVQAEKARINAAARPAAQAGAQVIYDAARLNAPVSDAAHFFYGRGSKKSGVRYGPFRPGNLRDSIYQVYSAKSTPSKAVYHIAPNLQKAPYAIMVENGTSKAAAQSYMGKAIAEKSQAALEAMRARFIEEVGAKP